MSDMNKQPENVNNPVHFTIAEPDPRKAVSRHGAICSLLNMRRYALMAENAERNASPFHIIMPLPYCVEHEQQ